MADSDMKEIILALLNKSRKGQVNWKPGEGAFSSFALEDDYFIFLPTSTINVYRLPNDDITATVQNAEGKIVARVSSMEEYELATVLKELLALARRRAIKSDSTLDEIKEVLASPDDVGNR